MVLRGLQNCHLQARGIPASRTHSHAADPAPADAFAPAQLEMGLPHEATQRPPRPCGAGPRRPYGARHTGSCGLGSRG